MILVAGQPAPGRCPSNSDTLEQLLTESQALQDKEHNAEAAACFAEAVARAAAAGDAGLEARGHLGLTQTLFHTTDYARAADEARRARDLSEREHDRLGVARADVALGTAAALTGDRGAAGAQYLTAIKVFRELGADADLAGALVSYTMAVELPIQQEIGLLDEAITIARRLKLRGTEARALHSRADKAFAEGLFDEALRDLAAAIDLFQAENQPSRLADAYVSLGRIHRAHGQAEAAIGFYEQAAAIQESIGEVRGLVQSTNAKAIALAALGRNAEARAAYERALEIAQKTGVRRLITFQQGNLASAYAATGEYSRAITLLEEVIAHETDPYLLAYRHAALAEDYSATDKLDRALEHARKGVDLAASSGNRELQADVLLRRARILRRLGCIEQALDDARASTRIIEETRARLVPLDFMKRGFSARTQEGYGLTISLLQTRGDNSASLVVSEQARSRAFLDLLASRRLVERGTAAPTVLPSIAPAVARPGSDERLASFAAATPASAEDIGRIAARLRSTILAYWVEENELFIWVVAPGAPVQGIRVPVSRRELEQTVTASLPTPIGADLDALQRLYRWLIQPVDPWLPSPGAVLTVISHGPLFRVSFAALRDGSGHYLIEKYALGYSPSISAFMFTEGLAERARQEAPSYLLVADPSPLPPGTNSAPLAALPASLREARGIRAALGAATSSLVLSGPHASELAVREAMQHRRIIHIATHAAVDDDEPLESFLAVGRTGDAAADDGRLTVSELYGLDLHSDLVILSACRTATGRLSGDGIAGLSRALFYAGAASVMATQWNVADEPSARLMVLFYDKWRASGDKRRALQEAQLEMIRELRAGSLSVRMTLGAVRLREQPFNWAGYVLFGEP